MVEHADGQPGNFKLYEEYHQTLPENNGRYVFGAYRVRGRDISVVC
jgi:hypothetical protein